MHSSDVYEQNVSAIFHKCLYGSGYLPPAERALPHVLVTRCKGKRGQNGIDLAQMIRDLNRATLQAAREAYVKEPQPTEQISFSRKSHDEDKTLTAYSSKTQIWETVIPK